MSSLKSSHVSTALVFFIVFFGILNLADFFYVFGKDINLLKEFSTWKSFINSIIFFYLARELNKKVEPR